MQKLAPIALFAYNRPTHLERTLNSLKENNLAADSELFVFSDGPKDDADKLNVMKARSILTNINGFKSIKIFESTFNKGLAKSVIEGVSKILLEFNKIIVLEDDIETSPKFISFMNDALNYYENNPSVFSISAYSYPISSRNTNKSDIYFSRRSSSWGWATWKNKWAKALWEGKIFNDFLIDGNSQKEFNRAGKDLTPMLKKYLKGSIDSWAIRWAFTHSCFDGVCVFPNKSLAKNFGTDGSGTNFIKKTNKYNVDLDYSYDKINFLKEIIIDEQLEDEIRKLTRPDLFTRILNFIKFL